MNPWNTAVAIVLGNFAFAGLLIWVVARARESRMRQRSEERARMLERFSSAQEITEFLNSPAGAKFLDHLGGPSSHPLRSLSGAVTAGIISLFAGCAFLIVAHLVHPVARDGMRIPGVLGIMIGLGILISAAVSAWLYRRAGLLPKRDGLGAEP